MGLFAGRSFRAGWAPTGGALAFPGGQPTSAAHAVLRRVVVGAPLAGGAAAAAAPRRQEHLRRKLEAALQLHMRHSGPAAGAVSGGGGVPRWELRCSRDMGLRQLTLAYIELCAAAASSRGAAGAGAGVSM